MLDDTVGAAKTLDGSLVLYEVPDLNSTPLCRLEKGAEFHLVEATQFDGRQWFEARLPNGTSGFLLGPGVMGHTTAGLALAPRRPTYVLGDPENADAVQPEPHLTMLLLVINVCILFTIIGILTHDPGLIQVFALGGVPLFGLCLNALLCANANLPRKSNAWLMALLGPVLWGLTITIFYVARGNHLLR